MMNSITMKSSTVHHDADALMAGMRFQRRLFASRDFRLLWLGEGMSLVGD